MPGNPLPRPPLGVISTQAELEDAIVAWTHANCSPLSDELAHLVAQKHFNFNTAALDQNTGARYTLLNVVVRLGSLEDMKLLLTRIDLSIVEKFQQRSFVYEALHRQQPDKANVLLDQGASFGGVGTLGNGVLHVAVTNQTPIDLVQRLIDLGADVNATNKYGYSVIDMALHLDFENAKDYLDLLIKNGAREWTAGLTDYPKHNEFIEGCIAQDNARLMMKDLPAGKVVGSKKI